MTREQAVHTILASGGRIVSVEFTKRSTGESRRMACRLGVHSRLAGGEAAYDAASKELITVWDMTRDGYRSIPVEGITRVNGEEVR